MTDPHFRPMPTRTIGTDKGESSLWVVPEGPFWFVPGPVTESILKRCKDDLSRDCLSRAIKEETGFTETVSQIEAERLLDALSFNFSGPYKGRAERGLDRLSEVWFHLTDACNLSCSHCLFGMNKKRARTLSREKVEAVIREANGLGCRLICFTGGEPFLYPDFPGLLRWILSLDEGISVAILTNGILTGGLVEDISLQEAARIHLQVSLDGEKPHHDAQRGGGTYDKTVDAIRRLVDAGFSVSIAMAVTGENMESMKEMPEIAHALGVAGIHFQYLIKRGLGEETKEAPVSLLAQGILEACGSARKYGISIDNVEALRSQVFTPAGTRFDLGNAGWESLAVGPDGYVYPTPALVDSQELCAGHVMEGLETVWRKSTLFKRLRNLSLLDSKAACSNPYRLITGGGDIDHSLFVKNGRLFLGEDPYQELYKVIIEELIQEECLGLRVPQGPGMVLRMGEIVSQCPSTSEVNFTHCNCLLSLGSGKENHQLVREFYGKRARETDELIRNPTIFKDDSMGFIPDEAKVRMYGCGSPVEDAGLLKGQSVVDLGCGSGVECFIAAKKVGPEGKVVGIDMTQEMLELAKGAYKKVKENLGYDNVSFKKGFLEELPIDSNSVDVVISNCVLNLSKNKRKVFGEIRRILRPGGKLVVSDVVTEKEPPLKIRANQQLRGQCIGGAWVENQLFSMLKDAGFNYGKVVKRFPYKEVGGHQFFSVTFSALKPGAKDLSARAEAIYAGPFQAVVTDDNQVLVRGKRAQINVERGLDEDFLARSGILLLDDNGVTVVNQKGQSCCSCTPVSTTSALPPDTGCLVCGLPLSYLEDHQERVCVICGEKKTANAVCQEGHFVCDSCHAQGPLGWIKKACLSSKETDMISLLVKIRSNPLLPIHGPEHHAMIPGIILSAYRNLGGEIPEGAILKAIDRGASIPGGACGFMGTCGAATGAGIALSVIIGATPVKAQERQLVQLWVSEILKSLAGFRAGRCCQRECFTTLKEVSRITKGHLPLDLCAQEELVCSQFRLNKECIRLDCPLFPERKGSRAAIRGRIDPSVMDTIRTGGLAMIGDQGIGGNGGRR